MGCARNRKYYRTRQSKISRVFFKSALTGKLSALNNLVGVFEYEIDSPVKPSIWEWK
jgi:hypothetical protein